MRRLLVSLLALAIVAVGGFYLYRAFAHQTKTNTVSVKRGTIVASVSATGKVVAEKEANLSFKTAGRVQSVQIAVGKVVTAGQTLASLEPQDGHTAVLQAQTNLEIARLKLADVQTGAQPEDVAAADANLQAAIARLDQAKKKPMAEELTAAKAALEKASVAVGNAQAEYDKVSWRGDIEALPQAKALQLATLDFQAAQAQFELVRKGTSPEDLKIMESNVAAAQAKLDGVRKGPTKETLAVLEKQVDLAQIALDLAQNQMSESVLKSPITGTVMTVSLHIGETVIPQQSVITLADLTDLQISANIDEIDIGKIAPGQDVEIALDAFQGEKYSGTIDKISPQAMLKQGSTVYETTIRFQSARPPVKPGMAASLTITARRKEDVLLLPLRAVQTIGRKKVVELALNGEVRKKDIETGLANEEEVEIISGLDEGDLVAIY